MNSKSAALRLHVESALSGRVASPFRLPESEAPLTVPTGIAMVDEVTGGLPRGALTELYGPPSSGKTSFLQSALASRTGNSEVCALVDAQDSFDPNSAQTAGVSLPKLLWIRCKTVDHAFRSVDLLLHGGGFGMVAMDLSDIPARLVRQIPLNFWFRLRRTIENTPTILLVLSRESNAKTCASLVLRLEQKGTAWTQREHSKHSRAMHTPACLLDGWTIEGEIARCNTQRKTLRFPNHSTTPGRQHLLQFDVRRNDAESFHLAKERTKGPG
jgi:hypothetical protein